MSCVKAASAVHWFNILFNDNAPSIDANCSLKTFCNDAVYFCDVFDDNARHVHCMLVFFKINCLLLSTGLRLSTIPTKNYTVSQKSSHL